MGCVSDLKPEIVSLDSLSPDPRNPRRHDEKNIEAIRRSLERFGQQRPIVATQQGRVIAGNGTLEAARRLGWREIAVVRATLSGSELEAFAVADNRTAELADWDDPVLARILAGLQKEHGDLSFLAFEPQRLEKLIQLAEPLVPPPPSENPAAALPAESTVRMVQLFLTEATIADFQDCVAKLKARFGTATLTDTVLECVRRARDSA